MNVLVLLLLSYIYIYIYKHCRLLCWVCKKNGSFLSFHSSIFYSKIHKHPTFKTNRDEQGWAGQKFEAIIWSWKIRHYFFAFTFRCMNAQALSLPPSISCNKPFFIKGLLRRGSLKSEWKQTEGREGSSLSLCLLCGKNSQIFQTANRVPSNKLLGSYFFYIYEHVSIIVIIVYIPVWKTLPSFMLSLQKKKKKFFSLFSLLNFSFKNS